MTSLRGVEPKSTQTTSAAARQNTGIAMTRGKSAAFHGHASALTAAHTDSAMMPRPRTRDALLCTRVLSHAGASRLKERIADHEQRETEEHQNDGPYKPGCFVTG